MQKLLFLISFIIFGLTISAQKVINDPNVEVRQVSSFHALKISGGFDVILTQASEESLAVSAAEEKYVPDIETTVTNGVLHIKYNEKGSWKGNRKLKAYIAVKNLDELTASGATDVAIQGALNVSSLKLQLSGASDLKGQIVVQNNFSANLSGASDINITGSAKATAIEAHGASDVKAYGFTTDVCNVQASGASDIQISVDKELTAEASGASSVNYKGSAAVKNVKASGASSVSKKS